MSTVNIFDPGSETPRLDGPILRVRGWGWTSPSTGPG